MVTNMSQLKPGATYIYERVDNVVYAREVGADPSERIVVGYEHTTGPRENPYVSPTMQSILENQLWHDIREAAKSNPTLQAELERVKMLYYLLKEENNTVEWHPV